MLGAQVLNDFAIFKSETGVDSLDEAHGVTGAASSLISMRIHKVISIDITEIVALWNFAIWNFFGSFVFFLPLLSKLKCLLKFLVANLTKMLLLRRSKLRMMIKVHLYSEL